MKALLWAVIGFLVVMWLLRGKGSAGVNRAGRAAQNGAPGNSEQMIRCAHCGVHMPASEALVTTGAVFCCEEHRLRHAAR